MFEVKVKYDAREVDTAEMDAKLYEVAGCISSSSGTSFPGWIRDHRWVVSDFDEAVELRKQIEESEEFTAQVKEITSHREEEEDNVGS